MAGNGSQVNGNGNGVEPWSFQEIKIFENALAEHEGIENTGFKAALLKYLPHRSSQEIYDHYLTLSEDVYAIDSGLCPLPDYTDENRKTSSVEDHITFPPPGLDIPPGQAAVEDFESANEGEEEEEEEERDSELDDDEEIEDVHNIDDDLNEYAPN